jgi:hypothetical protein
VDGKRDAIKELQTILRIRAVSNRSFPLLQEALNTMDEKHSSMQELLDKASKFLEKVSDEFDASNQMLTLYPES